MRSWRRRSAIREGEVRGNGTCPSGSGAVQRPGSTLSHMKLLRSVWGLEYGGELEYLRTYVRTLRKKIEKIPARPEYIVNVPWVGYRFRNPEDSQSPSFRTEQPAAFNS